MATDKKYDGITENSLKSYDALWGTFGKWLAENEIERVD